jgi:purine-cytosine permease-like protein
MAVTTGETTLPTAAAPPAKEIERRSIDWVPEDERHGRLWHDAPVVWYVIADLFTPKGLYGAWGWRGLTAYGLGFVCEIPFIVLPGIAGFRYTGPVAKHISGVDISWLVGLAVSGISYWLLSRSLNVRAQAGAIRACDEQLEAAT